MALAGQNGSDFHENALLLLCLVAKNRAFSMSNLRKRRGQTGKIKRSYHVDLNCVTIGSKPIRIFSYLYPWTVEENPYGQRTTHSDHAKQHS